MERDDFVEQYGALLDAAQATVLVGAGLSSDAGYPPWKTLADEAAAAFELPAEKNLPLLAQFIENQPGGAEGLAAFIAERIGQVEPSPTENHRLLAELATRDMWTTNYDVLLETADAALEVIAADTDLVDRRTGVKRLNKMHGSVPHGATEPVGGRSQLVITRDDYERYEQTHPRLWRLLQGEFLTTSFLFLGFSMTDPNFEAVFRIVRLATSDRVMPHFAVMRRPADDDGHFDLLRGELERVGVEVVEIDSYDEITDLLRRLVARTRPARLFISGSHRTDRAGAQVDDAVYPTAPELPDLTKLAVSLGEQLARQGIPRLVAAGEVGASVGYRFLEILDPYDHDRFVLVRRQQQEPVTAPNLRRGTIQFTGEDPSELRGAAFAQVRAVLVLGGGAGTLEEVARAHELGMSVIPLAISGGAAQQVWEAMGSDLSGHRIGQRAIDEETFALLNNSDLNIAIGAATTLALVGLFIAPREGAS